MALETIYKTVNENGVYSCDDIVITADEWFELLKNPDAKPYHDTLFCFLREPEHAATCITIAKKYGLSPKHYNAKVTNFAKWVQKKLNRFQVIGTDDKPTYWCIPMQKGWYVKQDFKWQLRDELVEALRNYLLKVLIIWYRQSKEPFNGYDEEYKWALLDKTEGKGVLDIIKSLKGVNLVHNALIDPAFKFLWENKPAELTAVVEHLFDESVHIDDRISSFKKEMKSICPSDWKFYANDERAASVLLMCKYPQKYTAYKDEIYKLVCQYFGYEIRKPGKKFSHFTEIINSFVALYGEKIQETMIEQIGKYKNKPLNLSVQTLLWCMRESMKAKLLQKARGYWLLGYSYGGNDSQLERFIKEGIWDGGFSEHEDVDQKQLADAMSISPEDIIILKSSGTKGPNHNSPFLRIKAVGIVTSDMSTFKTEDATHCQCSVNYINLDEKDFDGSVYGSYRKTVHPADSKIQDVIDYVNGLINNDEPSEEPMPELKYKEYIELLEETHNLVLTGAPGTGKTYMAQQIAKAMHAETMFVQFHPSYDYTDFVEGLRPIEKSDGQMGFKRRDGVFKEFCREAIKNYVDSDKSVETLTKEISWQERFDRFVEDAIENKTKYKLVNGSEFTLSEVKGHSIVVHNEQNEKTTEVSVSADEILELLTNEVPLNIVRDIRNYYNRKFGTQPDSYAFVITKAVRAMKKSPAVTASKVDLKKYVFIIDEINRGEASKIFGELFYAIDPGYRGKTDMLVQTQYQNLVPETDVFAKGFYIPKNVYILATMNDIDRSVESMDFAMRRRFTWHEVTPYDTESMLDTLPCVAEAKDTMHRLNNAIAETDGLGPAYMIGPSYFLKLGENGSDFEKLWKMNIEPLLKEYLRGFRKANDICEKFKNAYFGKNEETPTDASDLLE